MRPVLKERSSLTSTTWLSWLRTTQTDLPLSRIPSPLVTGWSSVISFVAPVAASAVNSRPSLLFTITSVLPSRVAAMPLALKPVGVDEVAGDRNHHQVSERAVAGDRHLVEPLDLRIREVGAVAGERDVVDEAGVVDQLGTQRRRRSWLRRRRCPWRCRRRPTVACRACRTSARCGCGPDAAGRGPRPGRCGSRPSTLSPAGSSRRRSPCRGPRRCPPGATPAEARSSPGTGPCASRRPWARAARTRPARRWSISS